MGSLGDGEFTRCRVQQMGRSGDGELSVEEMGNSGDGNFTRWRVQEMGSSRDGNCSSYLKIKKPKLLRIV